MWIASEGGGVTGYIFMTSNLKNALEIPNWQSVFVTKSLKYYQKGPLRLVCCLALRSTVQGDVLLANLFRATLLQA
jgi:hypothetical protein